MLHSFLVAATTTFGEPWDTLLSQGLMPIVVLIALWRGWLYLPSTVKDRDDRIEQLTEERDASRAETKELSTWVRDEAVPLVTRSTDTLKAMAEKLAESTRQSDAEKLPRS